MVTSVGGQLTTPVREVGYVRFKLTFGAQAALTPAPLPDPLRGVSLGASQTGARTGRERPEAQERINPGWSQEVSEGVVAGVSTALDARHIERFIEQPSPRGFATALFGSGFNANITVNDWLVLQAGTDSDFCFFSIGANIAPSILRRQVGSQTAQASGSVTLAFGPSLALWIAIATRVGPSFFAVSTRLVPSIAPSAVAGASSPFAAWLGPLGWAIPISIGIRDFAVEVCRAARARGLARGMLNQFGVAYVRHIYAMQQHRSSNANIVRAGVACASMAITRFGAASVQQYLERNYRQGRPVRVQHSQSGGFDDQAVNHLGFLFGEALFAADGGGGPRPSVVERY